MTTHPLDKKLREAADAKIADATYARNALHDLILMAEESRGYKQGYAYASVAIVWGRKERERLDRLIAEAEKLAPVARCASGE